MPVRGVGIKFYEVVFGGRVRDRADLEGVAAVEGWIAGKDA